MPRGLWKTAIHSQSMNIDREKLTLDTGQCHQSSGEFWQQLIDLSALPAAFVTTNNYLDATQISVLLYS